MSYIIGFLLLVSVVVPVLFVSCSKPHNTEERIDIHVRVEIVKKMGVFSIPNTPSSMEEMWYIKLTLDRPIPCKMLVNVVWSVYYSENQPFTFLESPAYAATFSPTGSNVGMESTYILTPRAPYQSEARNVHITTITTDVEYSKYFFIW